MLTYIRLLIEKLLELNEQDTDEYIYDDNDEIYYEE